MRKIWLVIKREYITRVRTKAFVFSTIALPLFTIGVFGLSVFMVTRQADHTLKIAILDEVGGLVGTIADGLTEKLSNGQPAFEIVKTLENSQPGAREELRAMVQNAQLDAYLLVPKQAV